MNSIFKKSCISQIGRLNRLNAKINTENYTSVSFLIST